MVLQFIDGVSLRGLLHRETIDTARAIRNVEAIAAALSAAHAAGVAHYDLKPENVRVQRVADGTEAVKLIDFGLAKLDCTGLPPSLTTVMIAGTVRYMAPES
jgi:eukaryotic-like serine/threonine-protein kinase